MMKQKWTPAKIATYVVLIFWALTTLYPFVWVILNSFREKGLIRKESFSIPLPGSGLTMGNYAKAMDLSTRVWPCALSWRPTGWCATASACGDFSTV